MPFSNPYYEAKFNLQLLQSLKINIQFSVSDLPRQRIRNILPQQLRFKVSALTQITGPHPCCENKNKAKKAFIQQFLSFVSKIPSESLDKRLGSLCQWSKLYLLYYMNWKIIMSFFKHDATFKATTKSPPLYLFIYL